MTSTHLCVFVCVCVCVIKKQISHWKICSLPAPKTVMKGLLKLTYGTKAGLHTGKGARGANCDFSNCREGGQWCNREAMTYNNLRGICGHVPQGDF